MFNVLHAGQAAWVELGHWLRKRTIVTKPDQQEARSSRCSRDDQGTARTIVTNPDSGQGCPDPTPNNYSLYFWAAGPGKRNRTIIRSGEPGWAGTRKANNG